MLGMSCPTSWQLEDRFIELDAVGRQFELELCPYRRLRGIGGALVV